MKNKMDLAKKETFAEVVHQNTATAIRAFETFKVANNNENLLSKFDYTGLADAYATISGSLLRDATAALARQFDSFSDTDRIVCYEAFLKEMGSGSQHSTTIDALKASRDSHKTALKRLKHFRDNLLSHSNRAYVTNKKLELEDLQNVVTLAEQFSEAVWLCFGVGKPNYDEIRRLAQRNARHFWGNFG